MSDDKKSCDDLFYVQRLRNTCSACHQEEYTSDHGEFTFHWGIFSSAAVNMISLEELNKLENRLKDNKEDHDTIILHLGDQTPCPSCNSKGDNDTVTVTLNVEKIVSGCQRFFTNNLYEKIHHKIYPLPLGLFRKEIADFRHLRDNEKMGLCYANFSITQRYRFNVLQWASAQDYIKCHFTKRFPNWDELVDGRHFSDPLPFEDFLSEMSSHRFCITPNGVGIDTDRVWECIYLNVVPVVQNNYGNRIFSKIWPMILVDKYETADLPKLMAEFEGRHGENIQYNHDLLLRKNLPELLDRIEYECRNS
tara:strand:+ start:376 stop:1296 length:921 start_codon:yes stop_codon:yes gene_type:complete